MDDSWRAQSPRRDELRFDHSTDAAGDSVGRIDQAARGWADERNLVLARTGDVSAALDVHVEATGTATSGVRLYVGSFSNTASFAAGTPTAVVQITPIDDLLVEPDETVARRSAAVRATSPGRRAARTLAIGSDDVPSDLIVSAVTIPAVGGAGAPIAVNETTKNQGAGSSDASVTAFLSLRQHSA